MNSYEALFQCRNESITNALEPMCSPLITFPPDQLMLLTNSISFLKEKSLRSGKLFYKW